ncbi:MAG: sigma-70 family RNA polymerase sigma factor [Candidatus Cloacimonadota bacterium]|nr:MAG: sigma-70 family RNA polymerase sigma factor [Candidatus Cloacimonadota bacterium]
MEKIDIQKFREGDENLFREIVNLYGERLYILVFRIVRDMDDAEDIVQETFVRAFVKRKGFRGDASIYTWLVRIAYNLSINLIRKRKPTVELDPRLSSGDNPEQKIEREEIAKRIVEAVKELPLKQRTVFTLRFYEDMPYKKISTVLRCKEGTAKALYHFAIEKMSKKLGDLRKYKE